MSEDSFARFAAKWQAGEDLGYLWDRLGTKATPRQRRLSGRVRQRVRRHDHRPSRLVGGRGDADAWGTAAAGRVRGQHGGQRHGQREQDQELRHWQRRDHLRRQG